MSDIETIQKPKRVYKKKVVEKVVEVPEFVIEPVVEPIVEPIVETKPTSDKVGLGSETRKRKYTPRKPKTVEPTPEPTPEPIPAPSPETSSPPRGRTSDDSDEDAHSPVKEKRPRTEKQIAAFNKMREARIKKQAELEHLKEVAKHQTLIDKEQKKLEKVEDQIIKKKAARKPRVKKEVVDEYLEQYISEPESFKVPTLKPILFM